MSARSADYLRGLVDEVLKLPTETTWAEFKQNNANPKDIGEYLSALSNAAALEGKENAYLLWGIEDGTRAIVGTDFYPASTRKGGEALESWLLRQLSPRIQFRFDEVEIDARRVVLLEIPRAISRPVQFEGQEFIRVGSHRQRLKDHPQIERELWKVFENTPFERLKAAERVDANQALSLLDYASFFELLGQPLPSDREGILARLADERMLELNPAGGIDITNLGAVLFAKSLDRFERLARKALRIIVYSGRDRLNTEREQVSQLGYATGFERSIEFLNALLPQNEVLGKALRKAVPMYPERAIRELVANALIHQDFTATGTGPMVEVFSDRMEITNPGLPLVETKRFLDTPPRSRNEALASFLRRVGICEERGSGIDKVVFQTEFFQLPAPSFETPGESTRAVLFAHRTFRDMDRSDRIRACYLHACLRHVSRDPMTNSSLRERFGIPEQNTAVISRVIRDAIAERWVKPHSAKQGKKFAKYDPIWA